jgi:hypothetical protein
VRFWQDIGILTLRVFIGMQMKSNWHSNRFKSKTILTGIIMIIIKEMKFSLLAK